MNPLALPQAAKAYVALAGSIATALLGVFTADSTAGKVCTIVVAIATGVTTWVVPNGTPKALEGGGEMNIPKRNEAGYYSGPYGLVGLLVVVILIVILVLLLTGRL